MGNSSTLVRIKAPATIRGEFDAFALHTILTASKDNTARLWDAASGKELYRFQHRDRVLAAAFSPDGRTIVTASADRTARLWDAASGKELYSLIHGGWVRAASFGPDSRMVITASSDGTARLWDAADGRELRQFPHNAEVAAASFSPDGHMVVTASSDGVAYLWDTGSGKELNRLLHNNCVLTACFSPDGGKILTAGNDRTACLWDVASGKMLYTLTHAAEVNTACFSPDGRTVLTASADHTARIWDVAAGKELHRLPHHAEVIAASFSPDGQRVVTAASDIKTFPPSPSPASPEDGPLVAAGSGRTALLWDAATGQELNRLVHIGGVNAASFSPDGYTVITSSSDETVRLWDVYSVQPRPDVADLDRVRAWVLVRTGKDFTEGGSLRCLSRDEWQQQRRALDALGGDWRPVSDARQWHLAQATEAEARKAWFAARFHLGRLLESDPNNTDLRRRCNSACSELAYAYAPLGRWDESIDLWRQACHLAPDDAGSACFLGLAYLGKRDAVSYRDQCRKMIKQFGDTKDAETASDVVFLAILLPESVPDPNRVVELARLAYDSDRKNDSYRFNLGASLYRAGRYAEAMECLDHKWKAGWRFFLVMNYHRVKQPLAGIRVVGP